MKQSVRKGIVVSLFILVSLSMPNRALAAESQEASKQWKETSVIWAPGEVEGVYMFHQFGTITTADGAVLVFAEGRVSKGDDSGTPHHICMKRSLDGGKTWGETIIVANAERNKCSEDENETNGRTGHCYANPTAVLDRSTGRIHLLYAENYDNEYSKLYITHSDDDGLTWSSPMELSGLFHGDPYERPFHLPGPWHGIQMRGGRLIVSVWHRLSIELEADMRQYGLSILYSDDGGETWECSEYLTNGNNLNEGRVAEMPDGRLMINARSYDQQRYKAVSADEGETWGYSLPFRSIGEYGDCDSGFYSDLRNGYTRLLTTHMENDTTQRNNLWIYLSYDEGQTWGYGIELWSNPELKRGTGASDITMVEDGVYGVIHGTSWDEDQEVRFLRVQLSDLIGTEDETQVKHTHLGGEATYFQRARCAICASPYGERRRLPPLVLLPAGILIIIAAVMIWQVRRKVRYRGRREIDESN